MIKSKYKFFNVNHDISNVTKNNHKHFDMDYNMSHVIKNNYNYFDKEYGMKINYKLHIFIFFCNISYQNKNRGQ